VGVFRFLGTVAFVVGGRSAFVVLVVVGSFGSLAMGCSLASLVALDISLTVVGRTCLRKKAKYGRETER
jgi:hypothetical protein